MGFQKGENGGSTGRPRGIKNKNTIKTKKASKLRIGILIFLKIHVDYYWIYTILSILA